MNVQLADQETVINFSREKPTVSVWTSDRTVMTKMDKLVEASTMYTCEEVAKDKDGDIISKTYLIADKKMLSFRKNRVTISEERRRALGEQLSRNRK
jgi:hypothetical protein